MVAAIIDSHPVFLNGLTQFLQGSFGNIQVLRAASAAAFENGRGDLQPDFLILGVNNFFKAAEIKTFETLKRRLPGTKTIVFYDEVNMIVPFLKIGVNGFLSKNGDPQELADCLAIVMDGKRYLNNEVFNWIVKST